MIFVMLFVLYMVTFLCYFIEWEFVKGIFTAEDAFVRVMTSIGALLFFIASAGMTLLSIAGTVVAIQNGFYL